MSTNRYRFDSKIALGSQLGTAQSVRVIRASIKSGDLPVLRTLTVTGDDRLDTLAGEIYGDARYWWILAAASNIGWSLQVPPGTIISVVKLTDVERLVG